MQKIKTVWKEKMTFESEAIGGVVTLDTEKIIGGNDNGIRPKSLMLSALSGCTGMDVSALLNKFKIRDSIKEFCIEIEANLTETHPIIYKNVLVKYFFEGDNLDNQLINKAVKLSAEKYCGVYAMFRAFSEIQYIIYINNQELNDIN